MNCFLFAMSDFYMQLFEPHSRPRKLSLFLVESENNVKIDNMPETEEVKSEKDNLFVSLRIFLRFGRLIGVVPLQGVFGESSESLKFSWISIPALAAIVIIFMLFANVIVGIITFFTADKRTASDVAFQSAMAIFYGMGIFVYLYILKYGRKFATLFKQWSELKELHFDSNKGDRTLFKDVNFVTGFVLTSAILENLLLFHLQNGVIEFEKKEKTTDSVWEVYYRESHKEWFRLFPQKSSSVYLGIFLFLSNKFALYAWNFADLLIVVFSRALYNKFRMLNIEADAKLVVKNVPSYDPKEWKALTNDHSILCDLLSEFDSFLSPLIFGCYASNIFFICLQIKMGITPSGETNVPRGIYTVWSFVHLILRVFFVSVSAARINDHAHATRFLFQMCPAEAYSLEVQRTENRLGTSVIGLTGLRCFVITKPFLLTIVGVVFTIEIVMLQTL